MALSRAVATTQPGRRPGSLFCRPPWAPRVRGLTTPAPASGLEHVTQRGQSEVLTPSGAETDWLMLLGAEQVLSARGGASAQGGPRRGGPAPAERRGGSTPERLASSACKQPCLDVGATSGFLVTGPHLHMLSALPRKARPRPRCLPLALLSSGCCKSRLTPLLSQCSHHLLSQRAF